mgnify:CR=1 FL=1
MPGFPSPSSALQAAPARVSMDEFAGLDRAQMITAETDRDAAILLQTEFALEQPSDMVEMAEIISTAHGLYEVWVNGASVDDSVFNPGWTSYEWRLQVKRVDVTGLIRDLSDSGTARVRILLGNGWYRGRFGFERQESDYGEQIGAIASLTVLYRDGSRQVVATSPETWTASASDVPYNSLYNGETIDARLRANAPELSVSAIEFDRSTLVPQEGPDVVREQVIHARRVWKSPSGKTLVDFGQNLVGWTRFTVQGSAGSEITIRHAEVIEHGELGTRPLRWAKATDRFILSGGIDTFEPTLTFHGFRYIEVEGWPRNLEKDDIEAVCVHSDLKRIGRFTCSNRDVNQLVHNSVWSQRGNFLDIPTDCPQRDEREGWTGDIAVYSPTAAFQFDCSDFLHKWLMDLRAETEHSDFGIVPMVVPDIVKLDCPDNVSDWVKNATAIWGDASVWVPWALWWAYGDKAALSSHYPAMKLHLDSIEKMLSPEDLWDSGFQFGDWLDPVAPPDDPADAKADKYVIAQACLYRSACIAAETASTLGLADDADHWNSLARRARVAFNVHYVKDGMVKSDATAAYALALVFGLLDEDDAAKAAARLAELIREYGYKVSTGFAGTPYITWALSENGYAEDAYRLLLERECPSWMYPVSMGATTVWERWDSMLPDGNINPGQMTSFNHYALGAVCDWVYQVIGGLRPAEPGYRSVLIKPIPGEGIDCACTELEAPVGRIFVAWQKEPDGGISLTVELPDRVPARIVLPDGFSYDVDGGKHQFGC